MAFTSRQLADVGGLDSDGMAGFEAQIALGSHKRTAFAPAHYIGPRVLSFERGAELARIWMGKRDIVGRARKAIRHEERKTIGMMTVFENDAGDKLGTLAEAAADQKSADARQVNR